jgi:hypothetical protein
MIIMDCKLTLFLKRLKTNHLFQNKDDNAQITIDYVADKHIPSHCRICLPVRVWFYTLSTYSDEITLLQREITILVDRLLMERVRSIECVRPG